MRITLLILFLLFAQISFSQKKNTLASKISEAVKIDGHLDELFWKTIPEATEFIQTSPDVGKPSIKKTSVKIAYDDNAIYVGAYLYDDPKLILKQMTRRDNEQFQNADHFGIAFDTYHDLQNAFIFLVTSANVQSDARISAVGSDNGFGNPFDYNWDAVWESKTTIQADGWIAEFKIPLSAIRFPKKEVQEWGLQCRRFIRRNNETSYWNEVKPNESGFVNQFGVLNGIQNIQPPIRLSFLPYLSGGYRSTPENNSYKTEILRNGGMDVKYGVNESFTLDMTLIPDFGQVISDNQVLNLTPFEVQFQENRPFFTEGTELFNKAGIFYSRRVGGRPANYYDVQDLVNGNSNFEIVKNPTVTQLLNATKFSGRTKKNLGIGIFNAVTASMHAEVRNKQTGEITKIETEPLTNYNVIVLDQAFKNRSFVTLTNTNVMRSGNAQDANVTSVDAAIFDKKNTYKLSLRGTLSQIFTDKNSVGFNTTINFEKISGTWQYYIGNNIESDKYNPRDLGFLYNNNSIDNFAGISYNIFNPTKRFLNQRYSLNLEHNYLYKPTKFIKSQINASAFWLFKNFFDLSVETAISPFWERDYFELRRGLNYMMRKVPFYFVGIFGSSDSRKKLFASWGFGIAESQPIKNDPFYLIQAGLRYRFSDRFFLELNHRREIDKGNFGAMFDPSTGAPLIINDTSIIGRREINRATTSVNFIYNFTPRMNLSFRLRHYWTKLTYTESFSAKEDGFWTDRPFIAGYDQNYNVFNIDCFYTWDFKPGCRLLIAWKNAMDNSSLDPNEYNSYAKNFRRTFSLPHGNEITFKLIYFIDYLQLKKKHKS